MQGGEVYSRRQWIPFTYNYLNETKSTSSADTTISIYGNYMRICVWYDGL